MDDFFETIIFVDDAVYDAEQQTLSMFVTIVLTGEKKVLVQSKKDYRYKESGLGEFPDAEMFKLADNFKGKKIKWRLYNDPNLKKMTPSDVENIVTKTKEQISDIGNIISEDNRIMDRQKENLLRVQQEARNRIKKQLKE